MDSFFTMLRLQLMLFLLVLLGVFATKRGILTDAAQKALSDLLINVFLPCSIVLSFQIDMTSGLLVTMAAVLIAAIISQAIAVVFSRLFFRRQESGRRAVLRYGILCSNAGFLGLPIAQGLFGLTGTLYASVALLPQRVLMWSAGLSLFCDVSPKTVVRNLLTHPCIVSVYIGFVVMFLPWELPSVLQSTLEAVGGCTTAVSMLVIGGILAGSDVGKRLDPAILAYCGVRLFLVPVTVLLVLRLIGLDPLIVNTVTLLSAMPAGSTTAILAAKYEGAAPFAAQVVFLSTLASVITLPLICLLF